MAWLSFSLLTLKDPQEVGWFIALHYSHLHSLAIKFIVEANSVNGRSSSLILAAGNSLGIVTRLTK